MIKKKLLNTIIWGFSLALTIHISLSGRPALAQEFSSYLTNEVPKRSAMEGKWSVQPDAQADQGELILSFLLEEFIRLIGPDIMLNEDCVVCNIPQLDSPCFIGNFVPARIVLTQESYSYWSQTIYQLSHEMCHYAFSQCKENKDFTLSWFEEPICEAMALYALKYASQNWQKCHLSINNPLFYKSHESYLNCELAKESTDGFKECDTVEKLTEYEKNNVAVERRETHRNERNDIYREILANPVELRYVLGYTKYIEDNGIVIDFDRWLQKTPCNLLNSLQQIQPVKGESLNTN